MTVEHSITAWRAVLAPGAPLLACLGALLGAQLADAMGLRDVDARFSIVVFGLALSLVAARLLRPDAARRTRVVVVLLAAPFAWALLSPRSAVAMTWLSGSALVLGLDAVLYAARTGWRLGADRALRLGLSLLGGAPALLLWASALVVLFNTQLVITPVRLAHLAPTATAAERAFTLPSRDGLALAATYHPGQLGGGGLVFVHGVSDSQRRFAPWAARFGALGWHSLRYDGRAHGRSEGAVVSYGQREGLDLLAAVEHLRARPGVDAARIFVVAASMGGGTTLAHARALEARGVAGLILLAPPVYYRPLVLQRTAWLGPLRPFVLSGSAALSQACGQTPMTEWRPASGLRSTSIDVLVFHGTADATIPVALSRGTEVWPDLVSVEGAGHDELSDVVLARHFSEVQAFLSAR